MTEKTVEVQWHTVNHRVYMDLKKNIALSILSDEALRQLAAIVADSVMDESPRKSR